MLTPSPPLHCPKQTTEYRVENKGTDSPTYFLVAVPADKAARLAIVEAVSVKNDRRLQATQVTVPLPTAVAAGTAVFQITLNGALKPGAFSRVRVSVSYTHTLVPFPAAIAQNEAQLVLFNDHTHVYLPHPVESQTTEVALFSSVVESFAPRKLATRSGDKITFGPYTSLSAPYTLGDALEVHSENNAPFATMRTMHKEIEVSHWGNVAVTEHYLLENTGAKLRGEFLRSDYQSPYASERGRASFHMLPVVLPADARELYFRDVIGNISSSRARFEKNRVFVELRPRYPLFGGWKADLEFGYSLPAAAVLSRNTANPNEIVLDIPFGSPFPSVCVDDVDVRVILPEGATNIRWETPFDVDSESYETRMTYLDTSGRPVLVLRKPNIVAGHMQSFRVVYSFAPVHLWREPGILIAAVFAIMLFTMVYVRVDLSFGGEQKLAKQKLE
jgi:oligosaccharyltransferase complex subunit alpha (ribophorin I)